MSLRPRRLRYGAPIALVVLGLAWAAVNTGQVGNTAGTALIAAGLILFMVVLGRDLGMGERTGRTAPPRSPEPLAGDDDGPPVPQADGGSPS